VVLRLRGVWKFYISYGKIRILSFRRIHCIKFWWISFFQWRIRYVNYIHINIFRIIRWYYLLICYVLSYERKRLGCIIFDNQFNTFLFLSLFLLFTFNLLFLRWGRVILFQIFLYFIKFCLINCYNPTFSITCLGMDHNFRINSW